MNPIVLGEPHSIIIKAASDHDAFALWVRTKGARSSHTRNAYRREVTRLLVWMDENNVTARTMTVDHVHSFYGVLVSPPSHWLRPRKPKNNAVLLPTQTLIHGLSASAIQYTRTVLANLFTWLQDANYVSGNPFRLSARPAVETSTEQERYVDLEAIHYLMDWIEQLPVKTTQDRNHKARSKWLITLLYHTGMRLSEAANGTMGDFSNRQDAWRLRVLGKGKKVRFVSCNSALLDALVVYRRHYHLSALPSPNETTPLVGALSTPDKTISSRGVALIVSSVVKRASLDCADERISEQLGLMSTHWFRHTNATHRLMAGASLETTQDELGHSDMRTTRIYAKTQQEQRTTDAEKLAAFSASVVPH